MRSSETTVLWRLERAAGLCLLLFLAGCQTGTLPDPNDPNDVGVMQPEEVRRNLKATSDFLNDRRYRGEINDEQEQALIAKRANELLEDIDLQRVNTSKAWEYGEIFIAARRWKLAEQALRIAVKNPVSEDRRVNDNLRLARVLMELDRIPEAIAVARSTFNCGDADAAPILPAVILEIAPASKGKEKGHEVEIGQLILDAIPQEERTVVDGHTIAGQNFVLARPKHIEHAYAYAIHLFKAAGRPALVNKATKMYWDWADKAAFGR